MEQLFFLEAGKLEWREVDEPALWPSGALVRPLAVAACDLDVMLIQGNAPIPGPFPLGHEFVGEVVEVGAEIDAFKKGERVLVSFQICCGECDRCTDGITGSCRKVREGAMYGLGSIGGDEWGGAFADIVHVPYANFMMLAVPENVDSAQLASGSDNLPDAWRTVGPQLKEYPKAEVLILGGGGPSIGLYAVQMAVAMGAAKVDYVDMNESRLELAERLGGNPIKGPPPEKMGRYQVTVDASGRPEWLSTALRSTDSGGTCTSIGIYFLDPSIPFLNMYTRGITFKTGRPQARATMPQIIEMVSSKLIDPMAIQTVVAWDDVGEALLDPPLKLIAVRN